MPTEVEMILRLLLHDIWFVTVVGGVISALLIILFTRLSRVLDRRGSRARTERRFPRGYLNHIQVQYQTLDLDTLTPPDQDRLLRLVLTQVFEEPDVRGDLPPVEIEKDLYRDLAAEGSIEEDRMPISVNREELHKAIAAFKESPATPLWDVVIAPSNAKLVVVGDPGSGKSTLARYLALSLASKVGGGARLRRELPDYLPLLVELRDYARMCRENRCESFTDYFDSLGRALGFEMPKRQVEDVLQRGKGAVLIFDGLDEIFDGAEREKIMHQIGEICYPKTRILVTSRIVGYKRSILETAGFKHFTLQDLDEDKIGQFTDRWYKLVMPGNPKEAELRRRRILEAVGESPSIRTLAGNPLLLTIMAIMARHQELPRERHEIYRHAASVLVEHWDVSKHLDGEGMRAPYIGKDEKFELLGRAALWMQERRSIGHGNFIARRDLETLFRDFLVSRFRTRMDEATAIARAMVDQFRERDFILCRLGAEVCGFLHRAFLEFFCANVFAERLLKNPDYGLKSLFAEAVDRHWDDDNWHEVLRLACGITGDKYGMRIADHVCGIGHWPTDDGRPPTNYVLALLCMAECRNPGVEERIAHRIMTLVGSAIRILAPVRANSEFLGSLMHALDEATQRWSPLDVLKEWSADSAQLLNSDKPDVRRYAIQAIARIGRGSAEVLAWIKDRSLHDASVVVRNTAQRELLRLPHDTSLLAVVSLVKDMALNDRDPAERISALLQLSRHWGADEDVAPILEGIVRNDPDESVRSAALRELCRGWSNRADVLSLVEHCALHDASPTTRCAALHEISRTWLDSPGVGVLLKSIAENDANEAVRAAAHRKAEVS